MGEGRQQRHLDPALLQIDAQGSGQGHALVDGGVHLPVARHQRDEALHCHRRTFSSRAATPGSSLPSTNSRGARPPVEMWVMLSATPAASRAAARSPPPTTLVAWE